MKMLARFTVVVGVFLLIFAMGSIITVAWQDPDPYAGPGIMFLAAIIVLFFGIMFLDSSSRKP